MTLNVFLDLDGTLTDPSVGVTRSIGYALENLGLPVPAPSELNWVIGPPLLDSFTKLGVPNPQQALDLYRERYAKTGLLENVVYSGIPEMLVTLSRRGHNLMLATAKTLAFAQRITAHFKLNQYLRHEFGPDLDGTLSDKGDLLAHALKEVGVQASQSIMVGDRIHDYAAAHHVGMRSVAVTWGFGSKKEWSQADYICDDPSKLPDLIQYLVERSG